MIYDYLIIGSGLAGSTFSYLANKKGKKCLVIEKRKEIGGNLYCQEIKGINVHKYGAHIFHTSNKKVWDFVNGITPFNVFINSPVANYEGELYNLPFNMNTFYQMWGCVTPREAEEKINKEKEKYRKVIKVPKNLEEQALTLVGKDIYEKLIKGYTEKQWGRKCEDLPSSIIKRLPVRFTFNNNYFNDKYQGIPEGGYNKLIEGLLKDVEVINDSDYFNDRNKYNSISHKIVYTGRIDEFYDYCYGKLDYRSLRFENEILPIKDYQGNAVVNYTSLDKPYTRIIEHKHFEPEAESFNNNQTIISKEYPIEWKEGIEPFYPVNDEKNMRIYGKYQQLAKLEKNVIFLGRLAEYKYYDMDDIIENILNMF